MSGTPKLHSAFPQTPQRNRKTQGHDETPIPKPHATVEPKSSVNVSQTSYTPVVPVELIDAPTQRLYILAIYVGLNSWRFFEAWTDLDELDSTWLFLKWVFIDGVFLFALQATRVPWLEWTFPTTLAVFLLHVVANMFLMFHIPLPLGAWFAGLMRLAYDTELSVSERRVKPADIIHNASLILGRQIIHILPEGSATLNPDRIPFCLDSQRSSISLPIRINQSNPILIELVRFDLDTSQNETIIIPPKQLKQLKRQAEKGRTTLDAEGLDLLFSVRKTGVYRLHQVLDDSKLGVQTRLSDTLVLPCPRALLRNSHSHKCKGELSDLVLEVEGASPLKVKYSRNVNQRDRGFSIQNIQPENLPSPLLKPRNPDLLVNSDAPNLAWVRAQKIRVPLNESLNVAGDWLYAIEEIHDAYGNIANYTSSIDETDRPLTKVFPQWHQFTVHERPHLSFTGCNSQKFLEVAKEDSLEMPLHFHAASQVYASDGPFKITYSYSGPESASDDLASTKGRQVSLKNLDHRPRIKEPGWYALSSISSQFCAGEILEPSSCYLHNPPEPELTVRYEKIFDNCANNSIGLLVDLDLVGSPPFRLRYNVEHSKGIETRFQIIESHRGQLDLTPSEAGYYRYRFLDITDGIYDARSLKDKVPVLEQDVKPPASAHILGPGKIRACFGEPISIDVSLIGESPWELQYELVYNGKKTKHELRTDNNLATIVTERLLSGGEYILSLTNVKDRSNCKRLLKDSVKIEARPKKPHVSFGQIEKERRVLALEDSKVELPLRLSGEAPWTIKYRNLAVDPPSVVQKVLWEENSEATVQQQGIYELVEVSDATCPGMVDRSANVFNVSWVARPAIITLDGSPIDASGIFTKREVCEGDNDLLEIRLSGNPPFSIKYEQQRKGEGGSPSVKVHGLRSALNVVSVEMDTSRAGEYRYKFIELADSLYNHDSKKDATPIVVQRVSPLPYARFGSPGHIYSFCKGEINEDELIPVSLEGVPPFSLEIFIKHHLNSKPETLNIPNINSKKYNLPIPRRHLNLGQHVVSIQKVRDARGCQRTLQHDVSSVRIAVSDVPSVIPLESQIDYCVGERVSFSLSGHAPFEVFYTFDNSHRRASSQSGNFKRIAEKPGIFILTGLSDSASGRCRAHTNITKIIHEMPSVKISKGQISVIDIREGGEAEINFEFGGTPPFEFTYIRSSIAGKGKKSGVLDVRHDVSYEYTKTVKASDEGTYEVVAIKDKYCSFSTQKLKEGQGKI